MASFDRDPRESPKRVLVVNYDPNWPRMYQTLGEQIWPIVQHCSLYMEHVGSTSVEGLAAKPIIDIDIVVSSPREVKLAIGSLQSAGYIHLGDLGIKGREAFRNPQNDPSYHLYVCEKDGLGLKNPIELRNYLRLHQDEARAYGELKKRLAERFPYDIDSYVRGKTEFVLEILRKTGSFTSRELAEIRSQNE